MCVDHSIAGIFINGEGAVITARVFPKSASKGIAVFGDGKLKIAY
ncbi:GH32 C-terminal domain-containing protein [Bacillus sp. FJAT-27245]